jgi:hypothetical protein
LFVFSLSPPVRLTRPLLLRLSLLLLRLLRLLLRLLRLLLRLLRLLRLLLLHLLWLLLHLLHLMWLLLLWSRLLLHLLWLLQCPRPLPRPQLKKGNTTCAASRNVQSADNGRRAIVSWSVPEISVIMCIFHLQSTKRQSLSTRLHHKSWAT